MPADMEWQPESVEDVGRPDLRASVAGEHPRLVIEAKFEHLITGEQLAAYAGFLAIHPEPASTALLLLVPEPRRSEAERVAALIDAGPVHVGVISWDQLLDALRSGPGDDPDLLADIRQLQALCEAYGAKDVRPFTAAEATGWPHRRDDLTVIIDRVTAELSSGRLYPNGVETDATTDGLGYYRRYISGVRGPEASLGVRQPRPGFKTPIWIRYHSKTADFLGAKERLLASDQVVDEAERGHLYVPLDVPVGLAGAEIVRQLKLQVQRVHSIALGRSWPELAG